VCLRLLRSTLFLSQLRAKSLPKTRSPSSRPALPASLDLHSPSGPFVPVRIDAFSPVQPPEDPPSEPTRSPVTPRNGFLSLAPSRINASGPLSLPQLAVPQTSWNLLHYAPKSGYSQMKSVISTPFSRRNITFGFRSLRRLSSALEVEKPWTFENVPGYSRIRRRIMPESVAANIWPPAAARITRRATAR